MFDGLLADAITDKAGVEIYADTHCITVSGPKALIEQWISENLLRPIVDECEEETEDSEV